MKEQANGSHRTRGRKAIRRRKLLAMLGAGSAGIAGCLGDGDDGGDGDSDGNGGGDEGGSDGETENTPTPDPTPDENTPTEGNDDTPTDSDGGDGDDENDGGDGGDGGDEQAFCSELLDGEFERYDEDDSPFVGTFEHGGNVSASGRVNNEYSLTVRHTIADGQAFDVFPVQILKGDESPTPAQKAELDGFEQFDELEFDGETVPLVKAPGGGNPQDEVVNIYDEYPYYLTGLPYNGNYYRFHVLATVQFAQDLETGVCEETWDELGKQMLRSLELNSDTTVESEGV